MSEEENKLAVDEAEKAVEQWKVKKLISTLEAARGNGTSMISLIIPPKDQISRVTKMLGDELGTAAHIKSRVNRLSVLGAIISVQQKLKLYNRVPPNGLVVYSGSVITLEGKEKKINIDFEPFKPINTSLYLCDNKFHTEALNELLESDEKFGFIVMDGMGTLFGVLSGNTRTILHKFTVDLPKKHGRGGQSALRFARLRLEKRHNYLRKVAETAVQMFITNDRPNVAGLILAGSAEFKTKLNASDLFDPRLQTIVQKIVDVSYGGENGFNQAIELAADCLLNVKFIREKKLLSNYFSEIAKDSGKFCFPEVDTRILTDTGLLFLDEIEARLSAGESVLYGCYDKDTKALLYRPGQLVFPTFESARLLTFASAKASNHWTADSGPYSDAGLDDESRHFSLRVTDNHRMFVQTGIVNGSMILWNTTRRGGRGNRDNAVVVPPDVVPASSLLSKCRCATDDVCSHRRAAIRMVACAESGYTPADNSDLEKVMAALNLDEEQFGPFLELFGFWLGNGTIKYYTDGEYGAVAFSQKKETDVEWLREMFVKVGLADDTDLAGGDVRTRDGLDVLAIYNRAWYHFFDNEFGLKYKQSQRYIVPASPTVSSPASRSQRATSTTPSQRRASLSTSDAHTFDLTNNFDEHIDSVDVEIESEETTPAPGESGKSTKPMKWFPKWIGQLDPRQLRLVVEGLCRADGSWASDQKQIFTSDIDFCDQLMKVLLDCGFSPRAALKYRPGTIRGYTRYDMEKGSTNYTVSSVEEPQNYNPIQAMADVWQVSWCEPTTAISNEACWPSLVCQEGITEQPYAAQSDGRLWCVEVDHPHHLIIAQRAERHGGLVTKQSRPVVTGNCFGHRDTLQALDLGAVEELIVWESLDINRLTLKNKELGTERVVYWTERQEKEPSALKEADGTELEVIDKITLLEWLANNFKSFGAKLQFVTNKSQEGSQFVKGFGGIGGLLRYQVDFLTMEVVDEDEDDFM